MSDAESNELDLLHVEATVDEEIESTHVEVWLRVSTSSGVRSAEAARAVDEIAELTRGLVSLGVSEGTIEIESAQVAEGKGIFHRGSSATFQIVLRRVDPDKLVGVMQTATELAHTQHDRTYWKFDVPCELEEELIAKASAKVRRRANAAARAAGGEVGGIHSLHVGLAGDDVIQMPMGGDGLGAPLARKSGIVSSVASTTGIELVKRSTVGATARAEFRLLKPV